MKEEQIGIIREQGEFQDVVPLTQEEQQRVKEAEENKQ